MHTVVIDSPAKINIHLEVRERRNDGFHNIISLFQMISLYDRVEIRAAGDPGLCKISGRFNFPEADNLIYKAVQSFRSKTGIRTGLRIFVDKRIPEGSGLGGGSSNAASTLLALNKLFSTELSTQELADIAITIGSDIPFFFHLPTAVVGGRGDKLRPFTSNYTYFCIIICPLFKVNTGEAYSMIDKDGETTGRGLIEEDIENLYRESSPENWRFFNSFYKPLTNRYPELEQIVLKFRDVGAEYIQMTGSGSGIYGIFSNKENAGAACRELKKYYNRIWLTRTLDRKPAAILK